MIGEIINANISATVNANANLICAIDKKPLMKIFDLFNNESINKCYEDAEKWTEHTGNYYKSILCCKELKEKNTATLQNAYQNFQKFCVNQYDEIESKTQCYLCVLPIGHTGKCCCNPHVKMFDKSLKNKFDSGIYSTPGNDGYIFKNRHNRLFPIAIPDSYEREIKNKDFKLQCAIPLKDKSTPLMMAGAYLDYLVFVANVSNVNTIKAEHEYWPLYDSILLSHKIYLNDYFASKCRKIFNANGFTECPVTGYEFVIDDFMRDCRTNVSDIDVQLGHCIARKDTVFTIRGCNITVMTREGNRLVGDYDFFDDIWIKKLKIVVSRF